MRSKGFTLVEMLAVIAILGILSTIAMVSYSRYRKEVSEKELINLRSTINDSYDNYRSKTIIEDSDYDTVISFSGAYNSGVFSYFNELSYDGKRLELNDLTGSVFKLKEKGDLLGISSYYQLGQEQFIEDGTCVIEDTNSEDTDDDGILEFEKRCVVENGVVKPSLEEMLCIKLVINDEVMINDFKDNGHLCHYFGE